MRRMNTDNTVYKTEDFKRRTYGYAWFQEKNPSSFYDRETDQQCIVPTRTLAEIRQELGL